MRFKWPDRLRYIFNKAAQCVLQNLFQSFSFHLFVCVCWPLCLSVCQDQCACDGFCLLAWLLCLSIIFAVCTWKSWMPLHLSVTTAAVAVAVAATIGVRQEMVLIDWWSGKHLKTRQLLKLIRYWSWLGDGIMQKVSVSGDYNRCGTLQFKPQVIHAC